MYTGGTASGAMMSESFLVLNQMLDSWTADRLMVFTITIADFPLTPAQQVYTMGVGGNFNTTRPAKINAASLISLNNPSQPLELPMDFYTDEDWQNKVPVKNVTSTIPTVLYDDGAYPLRNLSVWPIPQVACNIRLYSWTALTQFPDLVTDVTFPPGYAEALRYNLAIRLIAEMPGNYNPIMVQATGGLAGESLARIKSINLVPVQAFVDSALINRGGRYNYISDQPVGGRH